MILGNRRGETPFAAAVRLGSTSIASLLSDVTEYAEASSREGAAAKAANKSSTALLDALVRSSAEQVVIDMLRRTTNFDNKREAKTARLGDSPLHVAAYRQFNYVDQLRTFLSFPIIFRGFQEAVEVILYTNNTLSKVSTKLYCS